MTPGLASGRLDQLPAIHPNYLRLVCQALRSEGLDVERVLARAGLAGDELQSSDAMVSFGRLRWFILATAQGSVTPALALKAGTACHVGAHGTLGLALAASQTVGHAIHVLTRFLPTRICLLQPSARPAPGGLQLIVEPRVDLQEAFRFLTDLVAGAISAVLKVVTPAPLDDVEIRMPGEPMPWHRGYADLCGTVSFRAEHLAFHIPDALLDLRCPCASAADFAVAVGECERTERQQSDATAVADRVRRHLLASIQSAHHLDTVAAQLGLSGRSLVRRLGLEGTSFQRLLQEHRRHSALWQLRHSTATINDIAASLGYSDPSNFTRVFRCWFGCTPSDLRDGVVPWPDDPKPPAS